MERLIIIENNENRIVESSLFSYVLKQYTLGRKFTVCNVTEEEYKAMEEQVSKGKLYELEPRFGRGGEYNQFRVLMNYDGSEKYINITDYDSDIKEGKYLLSSKELTFVPYEEEFKGKKIYRGNSGIKVYTTKTYRDVLNYCIINSKVLNNVKTEDLIRGNLEIDRMILSLKERKYKILGYEYENLTLKK